jgi:hypothetical protein
MKPLYIGAAMKLRFPKKAIHAAVISMVSLLAITADSGIYAQTVAAPQVGSETPTADNAVLLTIFLRHDQGRPLV